MKKNILDVEEIIESARSGYKKQLEDCALAGWECASLELCCAPYLAKLNHPVDHDGDEWCFIKMRTWVLNSVGIDTDEPEQLNAWADEFTKMAKMLNKMARKLEMKTKTGL